MKRPLNHYTNQAIKQLVPYIFLEGAILLYFAYFYRYSYQKKKTKNNNPPKKTNLQNLGENWKTGKREKWKYISQKTYCLSLLFNNFQHVCINVKLGCEVVMLSEWQDGGVGDWGKTNKNFLNVLLLTTTERKCSGFVLSFLDVCY